MWIDRPRSNPDLGSSFVRVLDGSPVRFGPEGRMVARSACAECASLGTTTCGHVAITASGELRSVRVRPIRITPPRDLYAMTTAELVAERDRLMKELGVIGGIGR